MTTNAITSRDIRTASQQLASMRRSLATWLKYRKINDSVMAGTIQRIRAPLPYAQRVVADARDMRVEQDLADRLAALLGEIMPDAELPNANLRVNPNGAVQLAEIAITGRLPTTVSSPQATGSAHPWMWPALIVGGILLTVTTAIKSAADVAKDREEKACIAAGACTDYGFWLKVGGITMLAWFAWTQLGVGDRVKSIVNSKRRTA